MRLVMALKLTKRHHFPGPPGRVTKNTFKWCLKFLLRFLKSLPCSLLASKTNISWLNKFTHVQKQLSPVSDVFCP